MSETDEIRKENEITLKLSGKVKFSTTYDDKDPVYTMNIDVQAPGHSIHRLMTLFEKKVPIEVTFYSPQMNLPLGEDEEK